MSPILRAALILMARKEGACPGCDEATKRLTFRTADKLVGMGFANLSQRSGIICYRITEKGRAALASSG